MKNERSFFSALIMTTVHTAAKLCVLIRYQKLARQKVSLVTQTGSVAIRFSLSLNFPFALRKSFFLNSLEIQSPGRV
jgi:hypothetical protein